MAEKQTVAGAYQKIESHEELCAERYQTIHVVMAELKEGLKSQQALMWGILLSVAGTAVALLVAIVLKGLHLVG